METRFISTFLIISLLFLTPVFSSNPTGIPEGISKSINEGDCKELARFFNNNIELMILDNEDVYSKSQAELIMKDFFSKYPPAEFVIVHEGGRETSRYAIGRLVTEKTVFRLYFLLQKLEDNFFIHQMRIEPDDKE